ncbi:MAG: NAD(P)/FAD-dependent oxidoreductase [Burkholderiaceae bacterium]|nr:NAD(P)/FAD-dependent oxidoreductase [Burkholderiaceae bacterium]
MQKLWDAVIVGAGPAGASCAVWLRHLGLDPLLLEATDRIGGLAARNPFADIWTVTSPNQTGVQVADQIARQVRAAGVDTWFDSQVRSIGRRPDSFEVRLQRGEHEPMAVVAKTLVLATGVRPRELPGHEGKQYSGVIVGPGEQIMGTNFAGSSVALLGGGDNAFENYEFVKERGARVAHIYARTVRAQKQFVDRVPASDLITGSVTVDPVSQTVNGHPYDWILVLYGWQPNIDFLSGLSVALDARGFVQTDMQTTQTSADAVYAIGEVAQRMHPCVPTAMADGVVAAKAIEARLTNKT